MRNIADHAFVSVQVCVILAGGEDDLVVVEVHP